MKKCRQCGNYIDDNSATCPTCGVDHPFDEEKKKTSYDLTMMFDPMGSDINLYRIKSRKTLLVLAWLLGFLGAPLFYSGHKKKGFLSITIFVILFFIPSFILYFGKLLSPVLAFIIPAVIVIIILNVISGILFTVNKCFKDCNGEYLR